jgi:hypothetical protein
MRPRLVGFSAMVVVAACEAPKHPSNPGAIDEICQPLCAKRQGCDASDEFASCMNRCRDFGSPRRIYWREDYIAAIRSCVARTACGPHMVRTLDRTCFDDSYASLSPTPLARAFCERRVERDRVCAKTTTSIDKCVEGDKVYTDAILTQMSQCLDDHPCKSYGRCLVAIVGPNEFWDRDRWNQWSERPVPRPLPSKIRLEGAVKLDETIPIVGANVCVHEHPEIDCATTGVDGSFALDLPANQELAVTIRAPGMASAVIGVQTATSNLLNWNVSLDKAEMIQARYRAFGANFPDEVTGFIRARGDAPGDKRSGMEGLTMTIVLGSGKGPFYFDADSSPSPSRTSTSTWGAAVFANVTPGIVEILFSPESVSCVPSASGWAGQASNRVRVPVLAGYETHVSLRCHR